MNGNQLINMLGRMVTRHLMNWGTNKAIDKMAKRDGKTGPDSARQARQMRGWSRNARRALDLARRMGR